MLYEVITDPDYTPVPVREWNTRSMDPLLDSYSREACAAMCRAEAVKRIPVQQYQELFIIPQEKREKPILFVEKIDPQTLKSMKEFARQNNRNNFV